MTTYRGRAVGYSDVRITFHLTPENLRAGAIDTTGEVTSEETIAPAPRQRSIDLSPEEAARIKYRERYALTFGPKPPALPPKGKP